MGFVLVIVGLLMIVTGVLGTYAQFGKQVADDFTGQGNFLYWFVAIFAVGAVGYVDSLKTVSRLLIFLILVVMVLSNGGVFKQATAALKKGPVAPAPISGASSATNTNSVTPPSGSWSNLAPWNWSWPSLSNVFQGMANGS